MRILVAGAAALAAAAAVGAAVAGAAPERAPPGLVTFVAGEATRTRAGSTEKLVQGSSIFENDVVETQGRTRLEITLRDQSVVRVGPRSRVVISSAIFGRTVDDRKVAAKVAVGDVWARVARAVGGESKFEVQTANAVAGVRGTTFRVNAREDQSVVVKVYGGTVAVASGPVPRPAHRAEGKEPQKKERRQIPGPRQVTREQWEKIVEAMMQIRISADGTPEEPRPFELARSGADEFEDWNRERDAAR